MNRPEYRNGDLFENSDFRGMFIADHQEAIGEKANICVDELNYLVNPSNLTTYNTNTELNNTRSLINP